MDYSSRYGLEFNPFIKNTHKNVLIKTEEYNEVIVRLNYLIQNKGFGLLTGGAGKGKTTAIRNWSLSLSPSLYKVIYISLSTVTVVEFYRQLANEFGIEPYFRKPDNFQAIQEAINRLVIEKRVTPIIILDEASYIKPAILNDLKMLFNFEMDSRDQVAVLLVGLPQIFATLRLRAHEPLRQRIVMNYNMDGMSKAEAKKYIIGKTEEAKCYQTVFDETALEAISNAGNGTPRMIDKICNSCLMIGNSMNVTLIDSEIVMKAVNDSELSE